MAKENKKEKSKGEGRKEIDRSKGAKRVGFGQREWREFYFRVFAISYGRSKL